jgi:hypothetical protein
MTYAGYLPEGRTFEARMQNVLQRREKWLADHDGACVILVHANDKDTIGFWLTQKGAAWASLKAGGPQPGYVGFTGRVE